MSSNKTMLVTGASSGIGLEISKHHASLGGHLVLVARREERLRQIKEDIESSYGVKVHCFVQDITLEKACDSLLEFLDSQSIEIDYFVNNAGFGGLGDFSQKEIEVSLAIIDLNIVALTKLLHLFANRMIKKGEGKILNVGSTAGNIPGGPNQAVYCATKAYVNSLSRAVHMELVNTNVTVTLLSPGPTKTEFAKIAHAKDSKLFANSASAVKVAIQGYEGMIRGDIEVVSGLTAYQKLAFELMPMFPDKFVLNEIKKLQS